MLSYDVIWREMRWDKGAGRSTTDAGKSYAVIYFGTSECRDICCRSFPKGKSIDPAKWLFRKAIVFYPIPKFKIQLILVFWLVGSNKTVKMSSQLACTNYLAIFRFKLSSKFLFVITFEGNLPQCTGTFALERSAMVWVLQLLLVHRFTVHQPFTMVEQFDNTHTFPVRVRRSCIEGLAARTKSLNSSSLVTIGS